MTTASQLKKLLEKQSENALDSPVYIQIDNIIRPLEVIQMKLTSRNPDKWCMVFSSVESRDD